MFRAAVDDVGTIARLRGVGGGRRNYVEGHPHDGRVQGPLADTAFMLVTRFYTGLVRLDLRKCLVTKPLLLLLPDACPNLEFLMVHQIEEDASAADSSAWELNANMWGPDRVCSLTVKRLQLRMPKLRVVAYVDFFVLTHPTGSNGAPHEGFFVVAHARICAICRRKLPADAASAMTRPSGDCALNYMRPMVTAGLCHWRSMSDMRRRQKNCGQRSLCCCRRSLARGCCRTKWRAGAAAAATGSRSSRKASARPGTYNTP